MQATPDFPENDDAGGANEWTNDTFFIRSNFQLIRVKWSEICWVHADGNYCFIVTADKKFPVKSSLKKLLDKLPVQHFLRIHKAYVVKMDCIEKIDLKDNFVLVGEHQLPIGRIYKDQLLQQLDII